LRNPALNAQALCDVAGVKWLGKLRRKQTAEIGCGTEFFGVVHLNKSLIFDDVIIIASPTPPTVAGVAPFFDLDKRHFDGQVSMRKYACEMDELFEQVEDGALLGAAPAGKDATTGAVLLDEVLRRDNRLDDKHAMLGEERCDLVANGRQRGELDFYEQPWLHDVDAVATDTLLDRRAAGSVVLLQLTVESGFHTTKAIGY